MTIKHIVEETQDFLSELETIFKSMERLETTADNIGPTASYNASLFFGMNISANALWFAGSAIVLGVIYGVVHWKFNRRYRDSWEAYIEREHDRLDRIGRIFQNINIDQIKQTKNSIATQTLLQNLQKLIEHYVDNTNDLSEKIGETYINTLKISPSTEMLDSSSADTDTDGSSDEEKKKKLVIAQLLNKQQFEQYQKLIRLIDKNIVDIDAKPTPKINTPIPEEEEKLLDLLKNEKNNIEKNLKTFDMRLIGDYAFNIVFSYALAYWLVMYASTSAIAIPFLTTPVSWALLALTFPIIYLVYKEFNAYKERIIEKDLNTFDDETAKKTEKERRNQRLNFRNGWLFVGFIVMLSLIFILPTAGLSLIASISIGIGSLITIWGGSVIAGKLIDDRVETTRETLKNSPNFNVSLPERKQEAEKRRQELDAIALTAYQLELQSRLAEQHKLIGNIPISQPDKQQSPDEKETPSLTRRPTSLPEKVRLIISLTLSLFAGYAFGNMIFMVGADFLSNFVGAITGSGFFIATGIFSLILAGLFMKQTYYSEKSHEVQLDTLAANGDLATKQNKLETLEKHITALTKKLKTAESKKEKLLAQIPANLITQETHENLADLEPDLHFVHPIKEEGLTKRKVLFGIKATLQVIVSVSTAILFAKMVLLGGFFKLIPEIAGSSLMIIGTSVSPLGLAILCLALAVLLAKTINDIYLMAQREKEITAIERIDFDIACKEAEYHYLSEQETLIVGAKNYLQTLTQPQSEPTDSHKILSETPVDTVKKVDVDKNNLEEETNTHPNLIDPS